MTGAFAAVAGFSFQTAKADCRVATTPNPAQMPAVDFLNNTGMETVIELTATCYRDAGVARNQEDTFHVCVGMDGGRQSYLQVDPRYLYLNRNAALAGLEYNIYTDPAYTHIVYSNTYLRGTEPNRILYTPVTVPANTNVATAKMYAYVKIAPNQSIPPAGIYENNISSGSIAVKIGKSGDCRKDISGWNPSKIGGTIMQATVVSSCKIEAPDNIDFGEQSIRSKNMVGQTAVRVNCPKNTPYAIGLSSKYGEKTGNGQMKHKSGTALIPYALRDSASQNGAHWGDSGNVEQPRGSRKFNGTSATAVHPVYATIADIPADTPAGDYEDTVTVNVYY
ncbi:spore coat U domain-containing protein [Neisseria sp.]|uniref:Csu type fimbrial protein n=1 Tax=Neisseria sp. TaxID=192066 RepID=UPI0035A1AA43